MSNKPTISPDIKKRVVEMLELARAQLAKKKLGYKEQVEPEKDEKSQLCEAAMRGDLESIKSLIKMGANLSSLNEFGETALHVASRIGHLNIVKVLVEAGADIGTGDAPKETPLHEAALEGHADIVSFLIDKGADASGSDKGGCTALHRSSGSGHINVVKLLIDRNANVSSADGFGRTCLHWAATFGHCKMIDVLLENKAEMDKRDQSGNTAFLIAVHEGHADVAETLLDYGADHTCLKKRQTPLHIAVDYDYGEVVKALLYFPDIDLKAKDENGRTARSLAAFKGKKELYTFLGGDPNNMVESDSEDDSSEEEDEIRVQSFTVSILEEDKTFVISSEWQIEIPAGAVNKQMSITSNLLDPEDVDLEINDEDELLSDFLELTPHNFHFEKQVMVIFTCDEELLLSTHDIIIQKTRDRKTWIPQETQSLENGIFRAAVDTFSTFVAVQRLKQDNFVVNADEDTPVTSSVDPNIVLTVPANSLSKNSQVSMVVDPIEEDEIALQEISEDIKNPENKLEKTNEKDKISTSKANLSLPMKDFDMGHIVSFSQTSEDPVRKPCPITIPLPSSYKNHKDGNKDVGKLRILQDNNDDNWTDITNKVKPVIKGDYINFEIEQLGKTTRSSVIHSWEEKFERAIKKVKIITQLKRMRVKTANILLLHSSKDPSAIIIDCVVKSKADHQLNDLMDKGYTANTGVPRLSRDINIKEGQKVTFNVSGEFCLLGDVSKSEKCFVFHAKMNHQRSLEVKPIYSLDSYEADLIQGNVLCYFNEQKDNLEEEEEPNPFLIIPFSIPKEDLAKHKKRRKTSSFPVVIKKIAGKITHGVYSHCDLF